MSSLFGDRQVKRTSREVMIAVFLSPSVLDCGERLCLRGRQCRFCGLDLAFRLRDLAAIVLVLQLRQDLALLHGLSLIDVDFADDTVNFGAGAEWYFGLNIADSDRLIAYGHRGQARDLNPWRNEQKYRCSSNNRDALITMSITNRQSATYQLPSE